jgi:hypothetical protein
MKIKNKKREGSCGGQKTWWCSNVEKLWKLCLVLELVTRKAIHFFFFLESQWNIKSLSSVLLYVCVHVKQYMAGGGSSFVSFISIEAQQAKPKSLRLKLKLVWGSNSKWGPSSGQAKPLLLACLICSSDKGILFLFLLDTGRVAIKPSGGRLNLTQ